MKRIRISWVGAALLFLSALAPRAGAQEKSLTMKTYNLSSVRRELVVDHSRDLVLPWPTQNELNSSPYDNEASSIGIEISDRALERMIADGLESLTGIYDEGVWVSDRYLQVAWNGDEAIVTADAQTQEMVEAFLKRFVEIQGLAESSAHVAFYSVDNEFVKANWQGWTDGAGVDGILSAGLADGSVKRVLSLHGSEAGGSLFLQTSLRETYVGDFDAQTATGIRIHDPIAMLGSSGATAVLRMQPVAGDAGRSRVSGTVKLLELVELRTENVAGTSAQCQVQLPLQSAVELDLDRIVTNQAETVVHLGEFPGHANRTLIITLRCDCSASGDNAWSPLPAGPGRASLVISVQDILRLGDQVPASDGMDVIDEVSYAEGLLMDELEALRINLDNIDVRSYGDCLILMGGKSELSRLCAAAEPRVRQVPVGGVLECVILEAVGDEQIERLSNFESILAKAKDRMQAATDSGLSVNYAMLPVQLGRRKPVRWGTIVDFLMSADVVVSQSAKAYDPNIGRAMQRGMSGWLRWIQGESPEDVFLQLSLKRNDCEGILPETVEEDGDSIRIERIKTSELNLEGRYRLRSNEWVWIPAASCSLGDRTPMGMGFLVRLRAN